jgi:NAD(P)H-dependent FMN reductase
MQFVDVPILLGSTRIGRQSLKVGRFILSKMEEYPQLKTELLDLGGYDFPIMDQRLSEMRVVPLGLQSFSDKLDRADGLLIVSPEYKGGVPGVLKNALDYLKPGIFHRKPVGICTVSSGGFGGLNCLMQLRLTVLALGGVPIPDMLPVSKVQEHFDNDGLPRDGAWSSRLMQFIDELLFYTKALAQARQFESATGFDKVSDKIKQMTVHDSSDASGHDRFLVPRKESAEQPPMEGM